MKDFYSILANFYWINRYITFRTTRTIVFDPAVIFTAPTDLALAEAVVQTNPAKQGLVYKKQQQNSFANQLNPGLQGFANPQMALLQQQLMAQQARQMAMNGGLGNLAGLMNLGGINPQLLNLLAQQQMMQPAMMQSAPGNLASQNQGNFGSVPTMIDTSAGKKQGQDSASSSVSNHKPKKKKAAKASKAAKHVIDEEPLDRPKRPLRYVANSETFRFPRKRVTWSSLTDRIVFYFFIAVLTTSSSRINASSSLVWTKKLRPVKSRERTRLALPKWPRYVAYCIIYVILFHKVGMLTVWVYYAIRSFFLFIYYCKLSKKDHLGALEGARWWVCCQVQGIGGRRKAHLPREDEAVQQQAQKAPKENQVQQGQARSWRRVNWVLPFRKWDISITKNHCHVTAGWDADPNTSYMCNASNQYFHDWGMLSLRLFRIWMDRENGSGNHEHVKVNSCRLLYYFYLITPNHTVSDRVWSASFSECGGISQMKGIVLWLDYLSCNLGSRRGIVNWSENWSTTENLQIRWCGVWIKRILLLMFDQNCFKRLRVRGCMISSRCRNNGVEINDYQTAVSKYFLRVSSSTVSSSACRLFSNNFCCFWL